MTSRARAMAAVAVIATVIIGGAAIQWLTWDRPRPPDETTVPPPTPPATSQPAIPLTNVFDGLRTDAMAKGVSAEMLQKVSRGLTADTDIANLNSSQPEFARTAGDYVNFLVSDLRIATGREMLSLHGDLLQRIEARFGVDRHVLVAIWGVESNFGSSMGERSVIRSLATLTETDARRQAFWRGELIAALSILERGDITPEAMTGSWAGAMGHTQFIPTTYLAHAVDFDGDGKRDIWRSVGDALASTANYLKVSGWQAGQPPITEVKAPSAGFDFALSAPGIAKSWKDWQALGIAPADPARTPPDGANLNLLLPAGHSGPAFLTGASFRAILRYNNAVAYALAVAHLSDRLAGRPAFVTAWPASDTALTKGDREALQRALQGLGFEVGGIDGIIGSGTRAAIRAFQKREAMIEDGHPNQDLLTKLKAAAALLTPPPPKQ